MPFLCVPSLLQTDLAKLVGYNQGLTELYVADLIKLSLVCRHKFLYVTSDIAVTSTHVSSLTNIMVLFETMMLAFHAYLLK